MDKKNLGILIAPPKPSDFILGANSPISIDRNINDWSIYLPQEESQRNKITDFFDCVTMSAIHSLECQLNYLMATNQLSDEALNFFHNNGYINNGSFELSVRFNAKLNGTDISKGQYLNVAADCLRRDGFIPKSDWEETEEMSDTLFYSNIPIGLFSKAKKALWFIDIKYQLVYKENFRSSLLVSPIQVATEICTGWDSGQPVQKCSGQPLQHSTLLYGIDSLDRWLDLDHYPPFKQLLALDYEFPLNLQYVLTAKPISLRNGMFGTNVLQLQKDLNKLGFVLSEDSDFGPKTEIQVKSFQNKTGLTPDGIAGSKTISKLKELITPKKLLDILITIESGGDDSAEGDKTLTNHAYGCLQIRQGVCDSVNSFFGTNFRAKDCLGHRNVSVDIWNKYWQVYPEIITDEDRARTWNGGPGWKQIYSKKDKTPQQIQYCKNLDIYWSKVSKLLN